MKSKDKQEVLELLYKELNNITIKDYNTRGFIYNSLIRRGFIKAIEAIQDYEIVD